MIVRQHRGTLVDSLATAESIPSTESALYDWAREKYGRYQHVNDGDIAVDYYGYDDRIGVELYSIRIAGSAPVGWIHDFNPLEPQLFPSL